ncbi:uncharacterized protein MAM_00728 [Metarhizium album ARSEF 1941]|uniref:Uncharacterized protein n=1 Tax=Metarhizium album (strain ARSEF 1941) TaxID=1081103 RepID=A0A0B2WZL1_METAS|nr:uncharacterized protein MAM_00728 [Metarhizium album ARSEF 1941]KHO01727.1 hypothetical protein MAM_00728 [Metarhizium album ARSEF 1941]
MSPKAPVTHTDKAPYFPVNALDTVDHGPIQEDPGFLWQRQALNRTKLNGTAAKQQEPASTRDKPPLQNLTMSTQVSSKKISDEFPVLLNRRYSKNNSRGDRMTNTINIRKDQCQNRPSSVSTCGDLEGPYRVTPSKSRFSVNGEQHEVNPPPEELCGTNVYDGEYAHRSRSRTSNISRKRSSVNKHRSEPDPGRKKMLMQQVAQYWNECINIAEEEKVQARMEIDQLREDLRRQYAKLVEAHHHLDNERAGRKDIEEKLKNSEEKTAHALLENSTLSQTLSATQEELRSSKKRDEIVTEKYRIYRAKLNEAILEQQRLFVQAKEFYQDSIQKLRQENETRVAETKAIETALTNSSEKREQMRRCLDELRSGLEKEVESRNAEISVLRDKISAQEQALCTEKQISSDLRDQIMSLKPLQSIETQNLVEAIKSLQDSIATNAIGQTQQLKLSESVCGRLQNLEVLVNGLASHVSRENGIGSLIDGLHELVSTGLFSALNDIGGAQICTQETLVGIRNDCQAELGFIRTALGDLIKQQINMQDQLALGGHDSAEKFNILRDDVTSTRELCEHIGKEVTAWFTEERNVANAKQDTWEKNVIRLLNEGNDVAAELKNAVHTAGDTCLSKLDSLSNAVATSDDETKMLLQQHTDCVQKFLKEELNLEKLNVDYDPKETQRVLASLEGIVVSISEHLKHSEGRAASQGDSSQHNKQDEAAVSLQNRILQLEREVSKTTDLQKRWHSDIQIVDSIRSRLKSLQQLPSQVDGYSEQLAKISRVSCMLDSASTYLATQETWVKQQLGAGPQVDRSVATPPRTMEELRPNQLMGSDDRYHHPDDSKSDRVPSSQSDKICATQHNHSEFGPRKVQVQSPMEAHTRSSPPSIQQEQKRRRIPVTVRPILKANSVSSSQESVSVQLQSNGTETELGPILESKKTTTAIRSACAASQKIIADISSGFITDQSEDTFFNLPRVTDFQPPLQVLPSQAISQKRTFEVDGDECAKVKRAKALSGLKDKLSVKCPVSRPPEDIVLDSTHNLAG